MAEASKGKVIANLLWRFAESFGAQLVSFVVSILLARILDPETFGVIALVLVVTNILGVFVDGGFSSALVQKKDADDLDFSSVFWVNLVICLVVYAILLVTAPLIAAYYDDATLTPVIRVLGLVLIISGFGAVQFSYISRKLVFRKSFVSRMAGVALSAAVGIWMAANGYGVWALVGQQLVAALVGTLVIWFTSGWKPSFAFSWERVKSLFDYGWKLLVSSLIHTLYTNLRPLIVGKWYSKDDLGLFDRGNRFPSVIVLNVSNAIASVMFPVMSDVQDDVARVRSITRRSISVSSYIIWPLMMGLAGTAPVLVPCLLGEQWVGCVPYLIVFCFANGLDPMQTSNLAAMKALGRSDIFFKLELIKKAIAIAIVFIAAPFGVMPLAISTVVYSLIATFINAWPNRKLLNYPYLQQVRDVAPSFLLSLVMGIIVYFIVIPGLPLWLNLIIQIIAGVAIYVGASVALKLEDWRYLKETAAEILAKKGR
ncbi:MAG: oligosaccharide flippase family protein [Eggerthellaceae bacterium]|nr:oligosaccharide flippase family protein [Eggerthellaceae bacterium]